MEYGYFIECSFFLFRPLVFTFGYLVIIITAYGLINFARYD